MTAPISNEPTTTRLHHYAGHYFSLHHPGMRIIGFRKTLLIAFLVTDDSVVILSVLSTRQSRLALEEALTQALESFQHQR